MEFEFWPAVGAGIVGGVVMTAVGATMKLFDIKADLQVMWGAMVNLSGALGWGVGLVVHFLVSVAVAIVYAIGFALVGAGENLWLWGLVAGVVHWVIAGVVMGVMPAIELEPRRLPAPRMFVKNYGNVDVAGFLAGHLAYGLAVGIVYDSLT